MGGLLKNRTGSRPLCQLERWGELWIPNWFGIRGDDHLPFLHDSGRGFLPMAEFQVRKWWIIKMLWDHWWDRWDEQFKLVISDSNFDSHFNFNLILLLFLYSLPFQTVSNFFFNTEIAETNNLNKSENLWTKNLQGIFWAIRFQGHMIHLNCSQSKQEQLRLKGTENNKKSVWLKKYLKLHNKLSKSIINLLNQW